ncbi:hypothetical protein [Nonomuraea sp. NPDC049028]|uniref:hypothetical protein n=1 Tax=Nonomuraea sp. NPDC049028 TaxID=3364348 RepID=UPI00371C2E14
MTDATPLDREESPRCGEESSVITRGELDSSIVSACCETLIPWLNEEATVLVEDGKLVCPYGDCGAADDIAELDVATRTNELTISAPGHISASLGDSTFESDGFECQRCTRRVSLPDGYELTHS